MYIPTPREMHTMENGPHLDKYVVEIFLHRRIARRLHSGDTCY